METRTGRKREGRNDLGHEKNHIPNGDRRNIRPGAWPTVIRKETGFILILKKNE